MRKHRAIYEEHGFATHSIFNRVVDMTRPKYGEREGKVFAEKFKVGKRGGEEGGKGGEKGTRGMGGG